MCLSARPSLHSMELRHAFASGLPLGVGYAAVNVPALDFPQSKALCPQCPLPHRRLCCRSVPAHEGGCFGLAFDRLGNRMASCGADRTVRLWDPATAAVTATLHVSGPRVPGAARAAEAGTVGLCGAATLLEMQDAALDSAEGGAEGKA